MPSGIRSRNVGSRRLSLLLLRGDVHRPVVFSGRVHRLMHLAPLTTALNTVLANLPFAVAEELGANAVNQQVQGPFGAPLHDLDGQRLLQLAKVGVVGNGPVQFRHAR